MNTNERIKQLRKANKIKQADLAKQIGVPQSTLSKYENGNLRIDVNTLKKIADALNVNVSDLVEGCTEEELSKAAVFQIASSEFKKDISCFMESIFHRFGIVSSYRDNDTQHIYVTYNVKTYKIDNQKYEHLKAHAMNLFEAQIINLLELLDVSTLNSAQDSYITTEDRQKKSEEIREFETLQQFNKKLDKLFESYINKEGE